MNMKTLLAVTLCAGLVSAGAWAKDGEKKGNKKDGKHHHKMEERFEKMDANKDGSVSKDEFVAFHKEHHKKKDK
jgi:EF hand